MKVDRLMSITLYLLKHGKTSATQLAEKYEVNTRTIMRDIDTLCQAGIPIVSTCGINGGYEIMDTYVVDKQIVNNRDYKLIVNALKTLASAYENKSIEETIDKLSVLAGNTESHVTMDLSAAHENVDTNKQIELLEEATSSKKVVQFSYTNTNNNKHLIEVEPVGVIYKWYNWYLVGYSAEHSDYRMYKLVRMENLLVLDRFFSKEHSLAEATTKKEEDQKTTKIRVEGKACIKAKCREYLNVEIVKEFDNGDFEFCLHVPEYETFWYGVLLSFGNQVKVIEPQNIINKIQQSCQDILDLYGEKK